MLGAAAVAVAATTTIAAPRAHADSNCYTNSSGNYAEWYNGWSASYRYDGRFDAGPGLSPTLLDTHTPQGLTTWHDWNGTSADLLLVTAYRGGSSSIVQGINPDGGARTRFIRIAESHVGGITIVGKWVFTQGAKVDGSQTIRTYRLSDFRAVLTNPERSNWVGQARPPRMVYGAAFIASRGDILYSGRHNKDSRDWMYRYAVNSATGKLTTLSGRIQVPKKTQGLEVLDGHYVYSTSRYVNYRSNIYIVKRGYSLDSSGTSCFRAPVMSEGVAQWGGRIYVVYESGSHLYRNDFLTRNVITRLHWVPITSLTSLVS